MHKYYKKITILNNTVSLESPSLDILIFVMIFRNYKFNELIKTGRVWLLSKQ